MGKKFLDTNAILTDCSDLSNAVISSKTIEELENIKTNSHKDDEIKFKARQAVRVIKEQKPEVIVVQDNDYNTIERTGNEGKTDFELLAEYRKSFLNVDAKLIRALKKDLFMNIW